MVAAASSSNYNKMGDKEIESKAKALENERGNILQKIVELDNEVKEHKLVLHSMDDLSDPKRRCYRLVGGVLVESTSGEVYPAIKDNMEKLEQVITTLRGNLEKVVAELQKMAQVLSKRQQK